MKGEVNRTELGPVSIHTYTSPMDGYLVNSHVVETENVLVLVDTQFLTEYASELIDYVDRLGKPVDRIIVSHAHPDHWFGGETVSGRFPESPVFALDEVSTYIRENGQAELDTQRQFFGDAIAATAVVPERTIAVGEETIDGVSFRFEKHLNAEADVQLTISFPGSDVLIAPDVVFPNDLYLFIAAPTFDSWIDVLEGIKRRQEYDRVLVGHGRTTDVSAIDGNIEFLETAKTIYERTDDHEEYARRLRERYPNREGEWVELSAQFLYGVLT